MLSLADNRLFSTIPSWIDKWKNLTSLALDGNDFSGSLPPSFLTLSTLRKSVPHLFVRPRIIHAAMCDIVAAD